MFFYNQKLENITDTGLIQEEHFFKFDEKNACYDMFDNTFINSFMKLKSIGNYVITSNDEKRPDLISYNIYNTVKYWWLLILYNEILDSDELKKDKQLKYFDINDLNKLIMDLSIKQKQVR